MIHLETHFVNKYSEKPKRKNGVSISLFINPTSQEQEC